MEFAIEKLFNDMGCDNRGGIVELTRKRDSRTNLMETIAEVKKD